VNSDLFEGADRVTSTVLVACLEDVMGGGVVAGTLQDTSASLKLKLEGGVVYREFHVFGEFCLIEKANIRLELA